MAFYLHAWKCCTENNFIFSSSALEFTQTHAHLTCIQMIKHEFFLGYLTQSNSKHSHTCIGKYLSAWQIIRTLYIASTIATNFRWRRLNFCVHVNVTWCAQSRTSNIEYFAGACDGCHAYHDSFKTLNPNFLYLSSCLPTFAFALHFSQILFYLSRWCFGIVIFVCQFYSSLFLDCSLVIWVWKTKHQTEMPRSWNSGIAKMKRCIQTKMRIVFMWGVFDKKILISARLTVKTKIN